MSSIPSYAALLLEIEQAFRSKSRQTPVKHRFANLENKMSGHAEMGRDIIKGIIDALHFGHDPELIDDLLQAWEESMGFHAAIEHRTRTFGADDRQVAWLLAVRQYADKLPRWSGPRLPPSTKSGRLLKVWHAYPMLKITIDLWPHADAESSRTLAEVDIPGATGA